MQALKQRLISRYFPCDLGKAEAGSLDLHFQAKDGTLHTEPRFLRTASFAYTSSKASCKRVVLKGDASLHRFIELEKLLGEGWELSVFKEGERLHISTPVESGFASKSYDFEISQQDFSILKESTYRRIALEYLLYELLPPNMLVTCCGNRPRSTDIVNEPDCGKVH